MASVARLEQTTYSELLPLPITRLNDLSDLRGHWLVRQVCMCCNSENNAVCHGMLKR